ncbi:AraC family transcriptional regulator [Flammeovirga sp. OC4]|uniref:AraC family transcriptional regulator n=1 Tax=Flammeovirga sp. OC4 TaxID=1382345 RepID=UPI0005C5AD9A|nr:AraC family transcriptional regulator [Flammeovirga sp. OC4]
MKKNDNHRYMVLFENDKKWGFYINNIGNNKIKPNSEYPSKGHPSKYMFSWEKGRILDEYHLVMITKGEGVFESKATGEKKINAGDAFLLFPDVWHRYKPSKKTGWNEQWVGFSGNIAKAFMNNGFFSVEEPIIQKCNRTSMLNYFDVLFKLFHNEPFGYQRLASGICMQLIAESYNIQQSNNNDKYFNTIVGYAKHLMYKRIDKSIDLQKIADDLGVSYSKFRIDFKKQTGTSPLQYYLQLKIEKSKEILLETNQTQKEIAFSLGFDSDMYFNRLFKKKTGYTPQQYRKKSRQ